MWRKGSCYSTFFGSSIIFEDLKCLNHFGMEQDRGARWCQHETVLTLSQQRLSPRNHPTMNDEDSKIEITKHFFPIYIIYLGREEPH